MANAIHNTYRLADGGGGFTHPYQLTSVRAHTFHPVVEPKTVSSYYYSADNTAHTPIHTHKHTSTTTSVHINMVKTNMYA